MVYLDFWDSFCAPCRESFPLLDALRAEYSRDDVEILAVSLDTDPRAALSFLARHPVNYPVASDPAAITAGAYGLKGLPTAFLISRDGVVISVHRGFEPGDITTIRHKLAALIGNSVADRVSPYRDASHLTGEQTLAD